MGVENGTATTALAHCAMHCPFHNHPARHARPQVIRQAPAGDFDPDLLKPVAPPRSAAEVARLKSELTCLHRELATTQRAIDHLNTQLAA
jgi:hypothetical protein